MAHKKKILVFGGTGMLGSKLIDTFVKSKKFHLSATFRQTSKVESIFKGAKNIDWIPFEITTSNKDQIKNVVCKFDYVFNAIGAIPQKFDSRNVRNLLNVMFINSLFPSLLDSICTDLEIKLYTLGTDCVFSGDKGNYFENSLCDPSEIYGISKYLGEIASDQTRIIRTSIVGLDRNSNASLLNWFLSQPDNARIEGFENHFWNGITTTHFGQLFEKILDTDFDLGHVIHFLPKDYVSKFELLKLFARHFNRNDIEIVPHSTPIEVNRVLNTLNPTRNQYLWKLIGYSEVPSIDTLIGELALEYKH